MPANFKFFAGDHVLLLKIMHLKSYKDKTLSFSQPDIIKLTQNKINKYERKSNVTYSNEHY